MKKVGEVLHEERVRQRKQLAEISERTKIRVEFLDAIERNDFRSLPPSTFVRGFLQSYSRYLNIDEATVLALFRRDFKVGERGKIIPREYLKTIHRRRTFLTPRLFTMFIGGIFVTGIVIFAGMQWYRLRKPPMLQVTSPEDAQTVISPVLVSGKTQIDAVLTINSEPVAIEKDGSFEYGMEFSSQGEQTITVVAEDRNKRSTTIQRKVIVE